jgi:hypothetical protein
MCVGTYIICIYVFRQDGFVLQRQIEPPTPPRPLRYPVTQPERTSGRTYTAACRLLSHASPRARKPRALPNRLNPTTAALDPDV